MYQVSDSTAVLRAHRTLLARGKTAGARIPRTVVLLGLTSLFTDISSEMVVAVLPLYLVYIGGFSPLAFGLIDGLYNGATAFVGLAAGFIGDRWRRHKEVAITGYGLSAVCKIGLAAVGTALSAIGAIVLLDRAGKGIRTAPRDAMISLSTPRKQLGAAFGVHRALDTTGAMLGPLVAFALLAIAPLAFNSLFVISFLFALVGVAILVLFVQPRRAEADAVEPARQASLRGAFALVRHPAFPRACCLPAAHSAWPRRVTHSSSSRCRRRSVSGRRSSRCCSSAARRPSCFSRRPWAACRTASAAARCCSPATRCC